MLHLRTSVTRWAAAPLVVLGCLILLRRNNFWIGIWPETGAAVAGSAFFMSLIGAGISAWAAARTDVYGLREQAESSVLPNSALEFYRLMSNLFWLVAAYAVVSATAAVITARQGFTAGIGMYVGYILMGLMLIVFSAGWGWIIGRILNPALAALTALLSWFVGISLIGSHTDATPVSGPPWYSVQFGGVGLRLLAVVLFVIAVCFLPSRKAPSTAQFRARALSLVALVAVLATMLGTSVLQRRTPTASPLCVSGAITYCLWPENAKYVPLVTAVDRDVAALPIKLKLPPKMVDYAMAGSTTWNSDGIEIELPGAFDPQFDISEGSRWSLARGLSVAIVDSVFASCSLDAPIDPEQGREQLRAWLEYRLAGGGARDYTTDAPAELQDAWTKGYRAATDLTDADQAAWASEIVARKNDQYCRAA